ncbi:aminotransferase class IV [Owenweeksia hongkongensis]|uniref:aminotransferase class IV n=1 Tax=Owenweeksia hongkongensis TaxID=253245 RepID=UPI003A901CE9
MIYNYNGDFIDANKITLGVADRAFQYGDSVFESMKFVNGRINFWEDHYFRLMSSMRILRMEIPMDFSPEYLEEQIRNTLSENKLSEKAARIRLQVIRKEGGLYTPNSNDVNFLISVSEQENATYTLNEKGLEVDLFKDYYKQKSLLSNIKSGSAVLYTVASIFKKENALDECLLLNDDKMVAEAISANVFVVKGKEIFTPPLTDGCLKGVMRKQVLEILPKMGYEVTEKSISPFDLQKADELFLTNASKGIQWVEKYRKKTFVNDVSQALIGRLNIKVALT